MTRSHMAAGLALVAAAVVGAAPMAHAQSPTMTDARLRTETVASGFGNSIFDCSPGFVFVAHRTALVVSRVDGRVRRVALSPPTVATPGPTVLDLDIIAGTFGDSQSEWGVQAIALHPDFATNRWVYIRYDLSRTPGADTPQASFNSFANPNPNVIDRFVWDAAANGGAGALVFDRRIFSTPLDTEYHHGGAIVFDANHRLITSYGDGRNSFQFAVNINNPQFAQPMGVILRLTDEGLPAPENPFTPAHGAPAGYERWMAFGVRNVFGLCIDPITGGLWQSENGENNYDELNLVSAGFNGGWLRIAGPTTHPLQTGSLANLVSLPGSFYKEPVFSWYRTVGPTDVQTLWGSRLGPAWDDGLMAANFNSGLLWLHRMNGARTALVYTHPGLADLVDDRASGTAEPVGTEAAELLWGRGFGGAYSGALAIELGPDGRPYVLTTNGKLIRITLACPLDVNADGFVNPDDLGDYITAYFGPSPPVWCDYNEDEITNPDDLGDYITDYFGPTMSGC